MKNIFEIMKDFGLELAEDKTKDFEKAVLENYKTVADYEKQTDKVNSLTEQLDTAKEAVKKFEGVDPEDLTGQIADLTKQLADKETEYQNQLLDRDFNDLVKDAIKTSKGRNEKAIMALLDMDTLKQSKNQKEDVAAALKALTEAEDSKMLFGEAEPKNLGLTNPIGSFLNGGGGDSDAAMRAAMGLPPASEQK